MNAAMRALGLVFGAFLVAAFWGLGAAEGFAAEMGRSFVLVGQGELLFWAAYFCLLLPGLLLIATALPLEAAIAALSPRLAGRGPRLFGWGLLLVLAATLGARAGRAYLLADLPITGDENMVLFGSRMVAEGELSVPAFADGYGFTSRYFYPKDGRFSSMDFPGTIFFRAGLLRLGLGFWPFALLAAFSCWALVQGLGLLAGRRGAFFAAAGLLLSPMVVALSFTEHAHLLSRSLVALGWAIYLRILAREGEGRAGQGLAAALGGCFALAFCTRPAEALACFAPVFAHLLLRRLAPAAPLLAAAAAGPALLLLYNEAVTGSFLVSPRVVSTMHLLAEAGADTYWQRLGANSGFNAAMLLVYFLGPLTLLAGGAALARGSALARVAASAFFLQLLVGLAHGDTGIHLVGPIHYSESAVPLLVLTVLGLPILQRAAERWGLPAARLAALGLAVAAGQLIFLAVHAGILEQQGRLYGSLHEAVAELPPSVVIADPVWRLWEVRPEDAGGGTWVVDLPEPDPYFRDRVLFAQAGRADLALLRRDFPERAFYRLAAAREGPFWRLTPLRPPEAATASGGAP